ncbi:MAG: response regulator [Candidatus Sedimenticola sp. (ex Thyasira tokunagai)]
MTPDLDIKSGRLLIVDDKQANVTLLERMLAADGYHSVISTTDSRDACDLFLGFEPDLMILDLRMPHLDGFEVMERLKKSHQGDYLPVLVLTAQADKKTRLRALAAGAKDFIAKPLDRTEALVRIGNMLEVNLLHRRALDTNKILEQRVWERTRELRETQLEIIRRLGRAAEYKDKETGDHIIRMSRISQVLGRATGMSRDESELLLHASPMHDIGKIGIPDSILLKQGPLDDAEWELMKSHATIGYKMLDGHTSPIMESAKIIAYTHHEQWNGSGYPQGLKGDEIPLPGQICALADVFDALTSSRPYKPAWSINDAVATIEQQRGIHFSPELVDYFHANLSEIVEVIEETHDNHTTDSGSL